MFSLILKYIINENFCFSLTNNCKDYQILESADVRINQVENGKCLTIEEHKVPLSTKIIESGDLHFYECLICQTLFSENIDFEYHSKTSYTCDVCFVTFCTLKDLQCHNKLHNAITSSKCHICNLKFTNKLSLDKHLKDSHIGTVEPNPNMMSHVQTHYRSVKCDICKSTFEGKPLLKSHRCLKPYQVHECNAYEKESNQESDSKFYVNLHNNINSKVEMPFNCLVTSSHQEFLLKSHTNILHDEKPFICGTCHQCFSKKSLLLQHEKTHINIKYECNHCEEIFYKKSDIMYHMEYHNSKDESRPSCNQFFHDKTQFQSHKCPTSDETYQCIVCGEEFKYELDVNLLLSLCKDTNSKIELIPNFRAISLHQEPLLESNKCVLSDKKLFKYGLCNQCSSNKVLIGQEKLHVDIKYEHNFLEKVFYQKLDFIFYMINHPFKTSENYLTCNQVYNKKLLFQIRKYLKLEKIYQCSNCEEKFQHESDAKLHLNLHKDMNSKIEMTSNFLVKSLDQKPLLKFKNSIPIDNKTFKCKFCNELFPKKSLLVWHETQHADIKHYCCHFCDEVFDKKSDLIVHKKSHSPITTESCPICYQEFKKSFLDTHIKRIHTKVNPFTCHLCNKIVHSESRLINHLMAHTLKNNNSCLPFVTSNLDTNINEESFQCKVCNVYFELKTAFDYHTKYHSRDNLYPCNNKYTHQDENLFYKIKNTEGYPLKCHICKMLFTHEEDLLKHSKKHRNRYNNVCVKPFLSQMYSIKYGSKVNLYQYQCDICKSFIFTKSELIHHMKKHLKKKMYFCNFCGIKCILDFSLKPPENKNSMKCSVCTVIF